MTKIVEDDRARQAYPGRPVLYVLAASLLLAGIYLVSMVGWSGVKSPDTSPPQVTGQTAPASPVTPPETTGSTTTRPAPSSSQQ